MARPRIEIDPLAVTELISQGATVIDVADALGVSRDVIHARYATEITKGRFQLRDSLRRAQIMTAKMGNAAMLIWLGKQYLGQSDVSIDEHILAAIDAAGLTKEDLLELIKNKDILVKGQVKRSFEEFVALAGYPVPYAKQYEFRDFAMDEVKARLLLGARGYGKTDYTTILGVAYDLYLDPTNATNLIVTKSQERNTAILGEIQSACMKNGVVFARANTKYLRVMGLHGKDHSVSAVTIRAKSFRGRHPKRIIMDDPVTEDDISEATRAHVERVYNECYKLTSNICIIGQPAHKHDLYGKLRTLILTLEAPYGTIPELDADLEAQLAAGVSPESISASYHLKVLSEGTSPFETINQIDAWPAGGNAVAFIDPSEGGDYSAVTILKAHFDGVAAVGFMWKKAWNHCLDDLAALFVKYGVMKIAFETNTTGEQPIPMLREAFPGIGVVGRRSILNKYSKIMAAGAYAHRIHLAKESHRAFLDQVVKYDETSKFDDAPDSLASCLEWLGLIRGKR